MTWQPIESAPPSDTDADKIIPMLLWVVDGGDKGDGAVGIGYCYRRSDGTIRAIATGYMGFKITHWMPLPDPPVSR